jgi:hypothetical protein
MYGIAVADLGLSPSEVRQMTIGEICAIVYAKTRHQRAQRDDRQYLLGLLRDKRAKTACQ